MSLQRVLVAADAEFWPAAARAVLEFAADLSMAPPALQRLTWVVPAGAHAAAARSALAAAVRRPFLPPRVVPLAAWVDAPPVAADAAAFEVFAALRANAWARGAFGAQPAALWALARDVVRLADELTLAALDDAGFDGRLQASLARHYGRRAQRALEAPAALVLSLWRARRAAGDGAAGWLAALTQRAATLDTPLVFVATPFAAGPDAADPAPGWERACLQAAAARVPVLYLVPGLASRPLLVAAWPEAVGATRDVPIRDRALALRGHAGPEPLRLVCGASLEETAAAVAQQTLDWLQAGCHAIALVPLDRLIARRVRALLERAQVLVADETGWKLSTTSAAAALMRWFDLVADDLYWRDLLDWLKSSFTLVDRPAKVAEVALLERALRADGVVQGAVALRRALARFADDPDYAGALDLLARLEAQRAAALRAPATLPAQWTALRQAMSSLGVQAGLAADPVGRAVLAELDGLERETAPHVTPLTRDEFRALLAARLEQAAYVDRGVESPVLLVSLAATALRRFDAVALIGADAAHLPAVPDDLLFLPGAVRGELGLPTSEAAMQTQTEQLAALLAATPRALAAWRAQVGDEPNALSPLLQRLRFVAQHAGLGDLADAARLPSFAVVPAGAPRPQPRAAALLPAQLSASQAQSLIDCPYQFYARRLLGLAPPEDVLELPDRRDYGIALHEVLKRFHEAWRDADFGEVDAPALAASLRSHAAEVFGALPRRAAMLAAARRFDGLVPAYLEWLAARARAGWRWRASEAPQRRDIELGDGRRIALVGRIDRLDATADGRSAVIDYKARRSDALEKGLRTQGEDIQLPFYGLLMPEPPAEAAYLAFERAKVDASGVTAIAVGDIARLTADVGARLRNDLDRIAQDAVLPAHGIATTCAYCEMGGLCRRAHWDAQPSVDDA
jgi:ATP-dependent helicase/nuclease subunit B